MKHHAMRILTLTVFTLCTKVCWVHQIVRNFEQNRAQGKIQMFSTSCRLRFSVLFLRDKKPFVRKSETKYSDTVQATSLQYHHTCLLFLQTEEFVFGARRHDPAIDDGCGCRMHDAEHAAKDER